MAKYCTLKALRRGEVIDLGGIKVKMDEGDIKQGDLYIAEGNTGPHLLTARIVDTEANCIHPVDSPAYSFDLYECVKVREA